MLYYSALRERCGWAYDANSTVNFNVTGTIEEPSCEVSIKPSENIDLGTVSYQHMTGKAGANSEKRPCLSSV